MPTLDVTAPDRAAQPTRRRGFAPGDAVTVLHLGKSGHVRIPFYVRGHVGTVLRYCGTYLNPEDLAVGVTSGPAVDLYRVAFRQTDLWPDASHPAQDRLVIEVYDHWLSPADPASAPAASFLSEERS